MYVYKYTHRNMYIIYMYTHTYTHYIYMHTHTHTYIYMYAHTHRYIYIYIQVYIYMCIEFFIQHRAFIRMRMGTRRSVYLPICKDSNFELLPRLVHPHSPVPTPLAQDPLLQVPSWKAMPLADFVSPKRWNRETSHALNYLDHTGNRQKLPAHRLSAVGLHQSLRAWCRGLTSGIDDSSDNAFSFAGHAAAPAAGTQ